MGNRPAAIDNAVNPAALPLEEYNRDTEPWLAPDAEVDEYLRAHLAAAREDPLEYADLAMAWEEQTVHRHGIHQLIQGAITAAQADGKHCVLVMPPEHGKTSQIAKRIVWQIGSAIRRGQNFRVGLTSADIDLAKRNLIAIRKTMMARLTREIWPELKPDTRASKSGGEWSKEKLYLEGQSAPCLEIFPFLGEATGARLDMLWADDVVTIKCQQSEAARIKAQASIHGTFLRRLTDGGTAIFSNNCWHREDPIHEMTKPERTPFLIVWLGYIGFERIYWRIYHPSPAWQDLGFGVEGELNLWKPWTEARLRDAYASDRLIYKRMFEQRAVLREDMRFPPCEEWATFDPFELQRQRLNARFYLWLDPAGGKNAHHHDYAAILVVMIAQDKQLYAVDCWMDKVIPEEQVEKVWQMHRRWGLTAAWAEVQAKDDKWIRIVFNAYQQALRESGDEAWKLSWYLRNQSRNKHSRIDAINGHMHNGFIKFPDGFQTNGIPSEKWRVLVHQMEDFPGKPIDHDDGPDALAGAIEVAEQGGPGPSEARQRDIEIAKLIGEGNQIRRPDAQTGQTGRLAPARKPGGGWGL